jgi:hypothetical protein
MYQSAPCWAVKRYVVPCDRMALIQSPQCAEMSSTILLLPESRPLMAEISKSVTDERQSKGSDSQTSTFDRKQAIIN